MEGLTFAERDGVTHLLAICEGNRCLGGQKGKVPGGGRIQLFIPGGAGWLHSGTINLPESLRFVDYAGISVQGNRIAVLSQESAAIWVGGFVPGSWQFVDDGNVYEFPRGDGGQVVYCMVKGVSWIGDRRLVTVSDRANSSTPDRCRGKQQSLHIFELPVQ